MMIALYVLIYLVLGMAYLLASYRFGVHVDSFINNKVLVKKQWGDIANLVLKDRPLYFLMCVAWVGVLLWTLVILAFIAVEKLFKIVTNLFGLMWLWICTQLYIRSHRGTKR